MAEGKANGQSQRPGNGFDQERLAERLKLRTTQSPFRTMSRQQVDYVLAEKGRENKEIFDGFFARLESLMLKTDPVKLLSTLAVYGTFRPEGSDPEIEEEQPHLQMHFEIVQAFALLHDRTEFKNAIVLAPALVQEVFDLIKQVASSFGLKGLVVASTPKTDQERSRLFNQALVRSHTIAVRNAGYISQLKRLNRDLTTPLDDAVEAETGLRLTSLLDFLWAIDALIEERANMDRRKMASVFSATTIEDAASAYYAAYPELKGDQASLVASLAKEGATLDQAKFCLLAHRELSFPRYFKLSWDDLKACYPGEVSTDQLRPAMEAWSLSFGQLAGRDPEHFFLDNPVWTQPFIKLDDDTFFCPVSGVLWSFALRLIEEFVSARTSLKERYERRRDKFLEAQVESVVRQAFPSAQVFAGSEWTDTILGRNGENDLLVVLDDIALVIECKAGGVSDKALRAHPERLARTLEDLVVKPAEQARNFIALLMRDPGPHLFRTQRGATNEVDVSGVRQFVPISTMLDAFGALRLRWPLLKSAGFIPQDAEPTVTMSVADLEVVLEILDSETRRLHYLVRRSELESNEHIIGDEIDLLAHYLTTGFKPADLAVDQDTFVYLSMQSKYIDPVFEVEASERPREWPGTRSSSMWTSLLEDLDNRRPTNWMQASLLLLDVPYSIQVQVEKMLQDISRRVKRAPSSRAFRQDRRSFNPRKLSLVGMAFKGYRSNEVLAASSAVATLNEIPRVTPNRIQDEALRVIPICAQPERSGSIVVGL